jgi:hypothetical protein
MKNRSILTLLVLIMLQVFCFKLQAQSGKIKLGAYYFDGWTGKTFHISKRLMDSFPERKPIWGWITSTPENVQKQIDYAANAGISFFSFCWYYSNLSKSNEDEPRNDALNFYLNAPNRDRLQFNILVVNAQGYFVGPNEWDNLIKIWVPLMKNPSYLKTNNKPLISFFDVDRLIKDFGSAQLVKNALDKLRSAALSQGVGPIAIAACVYPTVGQMTQAKNCGFDVLTGYSYHDAAFKKGVSQTPIDSLIAIEPSIWNKFLQSSLPVIPSTTLNFDPRPWADVVPAYATSERYTGFSPSSVYKSISSVKRWVLNNPTHVTKEKIAIVYAWNETGEGSWLVPTVNEKGSLLSGLTQALK